MKTNIQVKATKPAQIKFDPDMIDCLNEIRLFLDGTSRKMTMRILLGMGKKLIPHIKEGATIKAEFKDGRESLKYDIILV